MDCILNSPLDVTNVIMHLQTYQEGLSESYHKYYCDLWFCDTQKSKLHNLEIMFHSEMSEGGGDWVRLEVTEVSS